MPAKPDAYRDDLRLLLEAALLENDPNRLEVYLSEHSNLPGLRMNTAIISAFADLVGEIIQLAEPPMERLEALLDGWAGLSLEAAPVNNPREILPSAAVLAYGQIAITNSALWDAQIAKLHKAASDPRWRVREVVAMALQRMLQADWMRTFTTLIDWLTYRDPLIIRAAAAAVAEPPLLKHDSRGQDAVTIQREAIHWLKNCPDRQDENVLVLRKALGFTVSVAIAAAPEDGLALIKLLAESDDKDLQWILKENLKKDRLKPWREQIKAVIRGDPDS